MEFRKKPVVIDADKWDPTCSRCIEFATFKGWRVTKDGCLDIPTLEGHMLARPGDWVIRGIKSEYYPCKPDIFEATYEAVD